MKNAFTQKPLTKKLLSLIILLFGLFVQNNLNAQTVPGPSSCGKKLVCSSNDVQIQKAYLSDANGVQLDDNFVCATSGTNVYLTLELTTNTPRIGISVFVLVKNFVNGAASGTGTPISECIGATLDQPTNKVTFSNPFNWNCGPIVLTDVFLAWGTGGTNFCTASSFQCPEQVSKCYQLPGGSYIPIVIPDPGSNNDEVCATNPGGTTAIFNLDNFKGQLINSQNADVTGWYSNQSLTTSINNPTNFVSGTTIVYGKLCTLKNGVPTTACVAAPLSLTVHQRPQLVITNPAAVCSPLPVDISAAAVTAGSILPTGTSLGYFDNALIPQALLSTQVGSGTYNIVATNPAKSGCDDSKPVIVVVKPTPTKPDVSVVNNCDGTSTLTINNPAADATFLWSPGGGTTNPLVVNSADNYTVTQTVAGCTSAPSDQDAAAPKTTPAKPDVSVVNNCNGTSTLTINNAAADATFLWSPGGGTTNPLIVSSAGNYTVTQTVAGCTSAASDEDAAAPKTTPAKPDVSVVNNCNGTSTLTINNPAANATFLWSPGGGTTNPLITSNAGNYTVTQTVAGCTSAASDEDAAAPKTTPAAPVLSVVNNCDGTSTITAKDGANVNIPSGQLTWSNGGSGNPISVNNTTAVTATRTINSCPSSASNSITPAPKTTPAPPVLSVVNNCDGTSTITAKDGANVNIPSGQLTWSNGGSGNPISVNNTNAVTAARTVGGCTSNASNSITPAPKTTPPAPTIQYNAPACDEATFSVTVINAAAGVTYTIKNKNGVDIVGVLPGNSFVGAGIDASFSNIPAGSGYIVTATQDGCGAGQNASCGTADAAAPLVLNMQNGKTNSPTIVADKPVETTVLNGIKLKAFPNPFGSQVNFQFASAKAGRASLTIYDATGKVLATVFDGNVEANSIRQVSYRPKNASHNSMLFYSFAVGQDRVNGKLLYK